MSSCLAFTFDAFDFLDFDSGKSKIVDKVLVASGGSKKLWDELKFLERK